MIIFITIDVVGTLYVVVTGLFNELNPKSNFFFNLPYGVGYYLWPIYQYGILLGLPSIISYLWIYKNDEDNKDVFFIFFEKAIWALFITSIFIAFLWNLQILLI
jgi:hypothetical protein